MSDHGSEKRQRRVTLAGRFNEKEAAAVRSMADKRGQSVGTLLRTTLLGIPPPLRSVRRPTLETQLAAKLLAELGKIGSNVNQYTKRKNMGREGDSLDAAMEAAMQDLLEMRTMLMRVLGLEPNRKIKD